MNRRTWKLDPGNAVNLGHPLVRDRSVWWYGVHGGGGRLTDIMPGGRWHGTPAASPTWTPTGYGDSGLVFNGSTQNVTTQLPSPASSGITVGAWFRPGVTTRGDLVTSWTNGTGGSQFNLLYGLTSGQVNFFITLSGGTIVNAGSVLGVTAGQWTQVVGTYDGTAVRVYIATSNSPPRLSSATTTSGLLNTSTVNVQLGNNAAGDGPFNGVMGSSWLYTRALTPREITAEYEQYLRGYRTPDSPLRWIRGTAFGLPTSGGGSIVVPRYIVQTRRRLTGVS